MIRVVVADDQPAVRAGLVLVLRAAGDVTVVAEAADGEEAVQLCRTLLPDVVVMDLRMPRLDGIAATRQVTASGDTKVLVLTTFDLDEYVFGALRAGAAGFLLKDTDASGLIDAVRTVARGDGVIAPGLTRRLIEAFAATTAPAPATVLEGLTPRERDVLACLGRGMSNREISGTLRVAEATAKTHISRILTKLDLRSRVQAAILAQELGLTGSSPAARSIPNGRGRSPTEEV